MLSAALKPDIQETDSFQQALQAWRKVTNAGSGEIFDIAELSVAGDLLAFTGSYADSETVPIRTSIRLMRIATAEIICSIDSSDHDKTPHLSPNAKSLAFQADVEGDGDYQLAICDLSTSDVSQLPTLPGRVEYHAWADDNRRILCGFANYGADVSGAEGAVKTRRRESTPAWLPSVESPESANEHSRGLAIIDSLGLDELKLLKTALNPWEAVWCGPHSVALVGSQCGSEGGWYGAQIEIVDLRQGTSKLPYQPAHQIGHLCASPNGRTIAFVENPASDRGTVAGELRVLDVRAGSTLKPTGIPFDVCSVEWLDDDRLQLAGHSGFDTVVGLYDLRTERFVEQWRTAEVTIGGRYATVKATSPRGDCAFLVEGFDQAPSIAFIRAGECRLYSSDGEPRSMSEISSARVKRLSWRSADGLEIQGWLLEPEGNGPFPLVTNIHGGPIWMWRPTWLGRYWISILLMLEKGWAVFLPNPRGSSGRGSEYSSLVIGDLGGKDSDDILAGIDYLVEAGVAERSRLGVMGISYGGYQTAWLICRDERFVAAVTISPHVNHVTEELLSNIPDFTSRFVRGDMFDNRSQYFMRSPLFFSASITTPLLLVAGAEDRCTPPEEARQLFKALKAKRRDCAIAIYPGEGHGIRTTPASIDCTARVVAWFDGAFNASGAKAEE